MYKIIYIFLILFVLILYCNQNKNGFSNNLVLNVESNDNEDIIVEFNTKDELFFSIEDKKFVLSTYNPDKMLEIYFEFPVKILSENNSFADQDIKFSCVISNGKNRSYFTSNKIADFSLKVKNLNGTWQIAEGFFTVLLGKVDKSQQKIKISGNFELKIPDKITNNLKILKLSLN